MSNDQQEDLNVARANRLDTASLSDAMDRLAINGQCYRIAARDNQFKMAGRAFTVQYIPAAKPAGTVGDFIDDVPAGWVVVIDNSAREDVTVWGDIMTQVAHTAGIAGTVIDGICRDVSLCRSLGYPVFSRGHWMRTGKDRVQVESVNLPVTIGGVRVCPGDILRGDADGVVAIPKVHEDEVLRVAEEIETAENRIRQAVRDGSRLDEARRINSYHTLQSKS